MKMKKILTAGLLAFSMLSFVGCKDPNPSTSNSEQTGSEEPTEQTFKVTYYLNDGTTSVYKQLDVKVNNKVTSPTNPTRNGYTFAGWFVDKDCLVAFSNSTKITADLSLYAKWTAKQDTNNPSNDTSSTPSNSVEASSPVVSDSSIPNPENVTYTIDSLPDWITNDGCGIFAWIWSDTNGGEWVSTTYDSSDTSNIKVTFTVEEEITGMLLVRTVAGTTTPDWEIKSGDTAGRIYNQTENIDVVAGTTTYSCSEWKGYPNQ